MASSLMPADLSALTNGTFDLDTWSGDFRWPVSVSNASDIALEIEAGYRSLIDAETDEFVVDVLTSGYQIVGALAAYLANLSILQSAAAQGTRLSIGPESEILTALSTGRPLPYSGVNTWTANLDQYRPTLRSVARRLKRKFKGHSGERIQNERLKVVSKAGANNKNRSPANALNSSVVLNSEHTLRTVSNLKLFQANQLIPITGLKSTEGELSEYASRVFNMVQSIASDRGIDIPANVAGRIQAILSLHLQNTAALYRGYSRRVQSFGDERFLVNALGNQSNRALAVAAKRHGNHVTAFLHGNTVFNVYEHNRVNLDVAICNEYVVYNRASIPRLKKIIEKYPPIKGNIPKFASADTEKFRSMTERFSKSPMRHNIKRVMIVEFGVSGDIASRFKPPDMINTDLIIRVAKLLRKNGYEVLLKRHPHSLHRGWSHDPYSQYMDISYEPFEDVMDETDAYLITFPTSTIFHHAVCSNKPIIYLDDGLFKWFDETRALFENRARVVRLKPDDRNRLMFAEEELLDAFAQPATEPDMSYAEQLLFPN